MSTITAQDQASTTTGAPFTPGERVTRRHDGAAGTVETVATWDNDYSGTGWAVAVRLDQDGQVWSGTELAWDHAPTEDADLVADLQAVAKSGGDLATLIREALTAANQAGVQTGRYIAGAGDTQTEREAMQHADAERERATVAMWRAFYDQASR